MIGLKALESSMRKIYEETFDKWHSLNGRLQTWDYGYRILYTPLRSSPDLMVIGENPGGGKENFLAEHLNTWPSKHAYFTDGGRFSSKMTDLFSSIDCLKELRKSIATNRIFFRTPEKETWMDIQQPLRGELENFCGQRVRTMVHLFQPKLVYAAGLEVFDYLNTSQYPKPILNIKKRTVGKVGLVDGYNMIGSLHPTGSRVATEDWPLVMREVKLFLEVTDSRI